MTSFKISSRKLNVSSVGAKVSLKIPHLFATSYGPFVFPNYG
tara:strand:+ start:1026 stop:1151 length:126 start_codon:yes stop_codon:yes gene_type:complete